ncbi:uncharacterized protein PG986_009403 [Apiospora aurea]|uniref:Uncharacterized protein n=1 Tax=Apiospora aurea TaxID=335848 RepID=A0ABR1Q7K8_9PEZI
MLAQYDSPRESLYGAPGRMMFCQDGDPEDCSPFYPFVLEKAEDGTDKDLEKIRYGHSRRRPPPPPAKTPTAGDGSFGGVSGSVPIECADKAPSECVPTAEHPSEGTIVDGLEVGKGAFGGMQGSIPVECLGMTSGECAAAKRGSPDHDGQSPNGGAEDEYEKRKRMTRMRDGTARRALLAARHDHCIDRLVISEHAGPVCNSPSPWGPDFVSTEERLYCDMCERQLRKLCAGPEDSDCFNLDAHQLKLGSSLGPRTENKEHAVLKEYSSVKRWRK